LTLLRNRTLDAGRRAGSCWFAAGRPTDRGGPQA